MPLHRSIGPLLALTALAACAHRAADTSGYVTASPPPSRGTITVARVGFAGPENVVYDSAADLFIVSNVNGDPAAKDGNGFLSRVGPDGRVIDLKWIEGGRNGAILDAPKGLALRGDTLAVADVGAVRFFDRLSGRPLGTVALPGVVMNDVAFADDGSVYVTDTGPDRGAAPPDTTKDLDAVWHVTGTRVDTVARGLRLDRPDGLVIRNGRLLVATFGGQRIERIDARNAQPNWASATAVRVLPGGKVDGLRRLHDGSLAVTSWDTKSVYQLDGSRLHTLASGVQTPAGIAEDTRRHRLGITSMNGDEMLIVPLP